jgi:hypothetical protein
MAQTTDCKEDRNQFEILKRNTAIRTAPNERYREEVLCRHAKLIASNVNTILCEHLSAHSTSSKTSKTGTPPIAIAEAVLATCENAMFLKAELEASGDDLKFTWFEAGSPYDGRRMKASSNTYPIKGYRGKIDITTVPGVDFRPPDSAWTVLVPAIVYRSS